MIYWLASYPRSGNTWCRAFLTNLERGPGHGPASINRLMAAPTPVCRDAFDNYLDVSSSEMTTEEVDLLRREFYRGLAREVRSPLVMKLHCAYRLASDGLPVFPADVSAGVVLIVRNPLDVAISLADFLGRTMDETIDSMASETAGLSSQKMAGGTSLPQLLTSWSGHARSWLDQQAIALHLVKYEDLVSSPNSAFGGLAAFLGLGQGADAIAEAVHHSRFEELRCQEETFGSELRPAGCDRFFRSGNVGGWRNVLSEAQWTRLIATQGEMMKRLGYDDPMFESERVL
jgi:aryl sulfotransferase